ncbi:cation:proton antiporter [Tunturiibacter gelidiferens]|uniref:cation:proton antiporter n=1 Tax=Tunturiibacter gelidiferens TaxID=3069689 RepID=UPI003D9AD546
MTLLLLQMTTVLLTALLFGWVARKFGQARVIGEIVGGIFLGPSVFGRIAPHASASLFPPSSLGPFDVLSTVGLILFLFLIGSQLEYEHLRRHRTTATLTSGMSIVLPFLIAAAIAPSLRIRFAPDGVGSLAFALFLGVSMSITAFPVLARILEERQLQSTSLGTTALMCAAVDDVSAWTLLAIALTLIPHSGQSMGLPYRLLWLGIYLTVMVGIVRPLGKRLARRQNTIALSYEVMGIIVAVVLGSAAATEAIGVHPLFGAFLAGVCFPRIQHWQSTLRARLDTVVSVLLLPFFFALTGMRTRLDLLHGANMWFWTAVVLVAAVAGKMGGAVLAARWTGQTWKNAWALGALLNTRGLVELIVLNIAYNAHVFSPVLFTMLVVMALITTMMTTPILDLLGIQGSADQSRNPAVIEAA